MGLFMLLAKPGKCIVLWVMVPGTSPVVYNKKGA
jgi:hypothetical protein